MNKTEYYVLKIIMSRPILAFLSFLPAVFPSVNIQASDGNTSRLLYNGGPSGVGSASHTLSYEQPEYLEILNDEEVGTDREIRNTGNLLRMI